jgi:galactitol-specific phosphotransferase system IIB component
MLVDIKDKLFDELSQGNRHADIYTDTIRPETLKSFCEKIVLELQDNDFIDWSEADPEKRNRIRKRADEEDIWATVRMAISSFEEITEIVVAKNLISYVELIDEIVTILWKGDFTIKDR